MKTCKIVTSRVVKKMYYSTHIAGRPGRFLNLAGTPIRRGQLSPLLEMKNQQKGWDCDNGAGGGGEVSIGWEAEGPQRETQVKDHPHFSELVFNCTVVWERPGPQLSPNCTVHCIHRCAILLHKHLLQYLSFNTNICTGIALILHWYIALVLH